MISWLHAHPWMTFFLATLTILTVNNVAFFFAQGKKSPADDGSRKSHQ